SAPKLGANHFLRRAAGTEKLETTCSQQRSIINQPASFNSSAEPKEEIHETNQPTPWETQPANRRLLEFSDQPFRLRRSRARKSRHDLGQRLLRKTVEKKMGDHEVVEPSRQLRSFQGDAAEMDRMSRGSFSGELNHPRTGLEAVNFRLRLQLQELGQKSP